MMFLSQTQKLFGRAKTFQKATLACYRQKDKKTKRQKDKKKKRQKEKKTKKTRRQKDKKTKRQKY